MAQLNYKGSSLVEVLIALVIIAIVFGLTISFFSNRNLVKSKNEFSNYLHLKRNMTESEIESFDENEFVSEKVVFRDSLCEIEIITIEKDTLNKSSVIKINPLSE